MKKKIRQKFKVFKLTIFQKMKTFCNALFFCMILILLMENSFLNLLVTGLGETTKLSIKYVTTITFATSEKSKKVKPFWCSSCHNVLFKTAILKVHLVVRSERLKQFYTKNDYELRENLLEKLDAFKKPRKRRINFVKVWPFYFLNHIVLKKKTHTKRLGLRSRSGNM